MHLRRTFLIAFVAASGSAAALLACSGGDDVPAAGSGDADGSASGGGATTGGGSSGSGGGDDAATSSTTGGGGGDAGAALDAAKAGDAKVDGGAFGAKCTTIGSPGDCQPGLECFNFGAKGKRCTMPCDAGVACPFGCTTMQGVCKVQ